MKLHLVLIALLLFIGSSLFAQEETRLLREALEHCRFNQKKTAEHLGMTYHQLRGYLRKYGLTDASE